MINKKIFKPEFIRLDNKTFDKKYKLLSDQIKEDIESLSKLKDIFDKIESGVYNINDFPEKYKNLVELGYGKR